MTSHELFQAGNLTDAVTAALGEVKAKPTDTSCRGLLCELFLFVGELERADKQLETIGQQDAGSIPGISLLRQLVRAETARRQFYREGRLPEFLFDVSPVLRLHLEASVAIRDGNVSDAAQLLAQAEQQRPHPCGVCDGRPFDDWRDLDDLTAPFFEVLTSTGKYFWIPVERVSSIEFRAPKRPQDLFWRRAQMVVREGPDGEVYMPTLYHATDASDDDQLRLGRATVWSGGDGEPARGTGQRTYLVGDQDTTILQLGNVEFRAS